MHSQAPDYLTVVKEPMDFARMRKRLDNGEYPSFDALSKDFLLICSNCMLYNPPESVFYRQAQKLLDAAVPRIAAAKDKWEGALNDFIAWLSIHGHVYLGLAAGEERSIASLGGLGSASAVHANFLAGDV